jgi:hypothetical protein
VNEPRRPARAGRRKRHPEIGAEIHRLAREPVVFSINAAEHTLGEYKYAEVEAEGGFICIWLVAKAKANRRRPVRAASCTDLRHLINRKIRDWAGKAGESLTEIAKSYDISQSYED